MFPIDVLYTWAGETRKEHMRLTDHGELKHSLRSVSQFLPWVNRVFVVMNKKQKPSWFSDDYANWVTLLDHDDIFVDNLPVTRPVTNSNSIETAISNAPGLSEHFIYFNDDFFITRPTPQTYFFTTDGKAIVNQYKRADTKKSRLKNLPPLTKGFHAHTPLPLRRSAYDQFKRTYSEYIEWIRTQNERIGIGCDRCLEMSLPCPCQQSVHGTFGWWMINNGFAVPRDNQVNDTNQNYFNHENYMVLRTLRLDDIPTNTFTINDSAETNREQFGTVIRDFLARVFPVPAPFENKQQQEKITALAKDEYYPLKLALLGVLLVVIIVVLVTFFRRFHL